MSTLTIFLLTANSKLHFKFKLVNRNHKIQLLFLHSSYTIHCLQSRSPPLKWVRQPTLQLTYQVQLAQNRYQGLCFISPEVKNFFI